jgi:RNA polymerase sigma factor (sigma-70 family)
MDELEVVDRFDRQRPQLRAVAYRILGSLNEADDAVQEAWLRLGRTDAEHIASLERWLTTVVARICLNMLRLRRTRGEQPLDGFLPEPIIDDPAVGTDPEHEALLADSVGIALQVVLDTLSPAERLAFVLHDMFAVPFDEIAAMVDRSPEATRQLASRARRRVRGAAPEPDAEVSAQQAVVDAFMAAAREGDFDRLVAILDPDVVLRTDRGAVVADMPREVRGAEAVARRAIGYSRLGLEMRPALVNGTAGGVAFRDATPFAIMGIIVRGGRIAEMDVFADPERIGRIDLTVLD